MIQVYTGSRHIDGICARPRRGLHDLARRCASPASPRTAAITYGHGKVENLSALFETLLLLLTCAWIVYEAIDRSSYDIRRRRGHRLVLHRHDHLDRRRRFALAHALPRREEVQQPGARGRRPPLQHRHLELRRRHPRPSSAGRPATTPESGLHGRGGRHRRDPRRPHRPLSSPCGWGSGRSRRSSTPRPRGCARRSSRRWRRCPASSTATTCGCATSGRKPLRRHPRPRRRRTDAPAGARAD